ncbi:MAG: Coenzyme F420 hydrogenase/dehydrogenase, beta subunit C-terminal domain [Clostridia bacterium]|nr:Coenzyme F420 hydrogenase/dehydrogenase, beta subunit C-terminal domain [Clostridia bacterium]
MSNNIGDYNKCCGCGACFNICPKNAIIMEEDENGFLYPSINKQLCINCGLCKSVCNFNNYKKKETGEYPKVNVACSKEEDILKKSSSGGIFATIAKAIINDGGVVYGCALRKEDDYLKPVHIRIDNNDDLIKIQGSKYVQSYIGNMYAKVKEDLNAGKKVLFSGTPCQIAGLKSYLKNTNMDNLFLIDIICHGTPSMKMFQDYQDFLKKKYKGEIKEFIFRNKENGWNSKGIKGKVTIEQSRKKEKDVMINQHNSAYINLFIETAIQREECYSCPYASDKREGDITIGDYWGIDKIHPEVLKENGGKMELSKGISCLLINTEKGKRMVELCKKNMIMYESDFEKVSRKNGQLLHPCKSRLDREEILKIYRNENYEGLEKWLNKKLGVKKAIYYLWDKLPSNLKKKVKRH